MPPAMSAPPSLMLSLRGLLLCGAVLRMCLLLWGEWQDRRLAVPYTDIDYGVFSDAALLVNNGASPYDRSTYRYSPLVSAQQHNTGTQDTHRTAHSSVRALMWPSCGMVFVCLPARACVVAARGCWCR